MPDAGASPGPSRHHVGGSDPPLHLLLVGAQPGLRSALQRWTEDLPAELVTSAQARPAYQVLAEGGWDAILVILEGADRHGDLAWWGTALERLHRRLPFIVLTDHPSMDLVLAASHSGRAEVLSLPPAPQELRGVLLRIREPAGEARIPLDDLGLEEDEPEALIGESPAMLEVFRLIARVAPTTATVLIEGLSGTGKEVVARYIHEHSPIASGPFVAVNCAAISATLLESELFGHERGAFTGAISRKIGSFQLAEGGTLFLDEVAEMGLPLQAKILRAVQQREIQRVGGTEPIRMRVRLMAATNVPVGEAMRVGRLREDLYYRLAVVRIRLPPLADRGDDVALLTAHFVRHFADHYGKPIDAISDRALAMLREHPWEGNVRELRNAVERAVLVAHGRTIRAEHLPEEIRHAIMEPVAPVEDLSLEAAEARHIRRVLARTGGNMSQAADILGIHRNTLTRKVRRSSPGVSRDDDRPVSHDR